MSPETDAEPMSLEADADQAAGLRDRRALARLLSAVEDDGPHAAVPLAPARAEVIGITGAPGVGKSTLTAALIGRLRALGRTVGVLAVDPTSPFTGGALLGDRVRMQQHATDPGVYIRSMASRGQLGGLAAATPGAVRVLDVAGFDVVLVETVGVGQVEVEIAALADSTLVLLAPGMGDGVQAAKAGLLEAADVMVVNKADRDGADNALRELRQMVSTVPPSAGAWRPQVVRAVASRDDVAEVVEAIEKHRAWLVSSGEGVRRRRRRAAQEINALVLARLSARYGLHADGGRLDELADEVVAGRLAPASAADYLVAG